VRGKGKWTYLGRAGLEGLHGPAEHLHLALSEGGRRSGGAIGASGAGVVVRHGDVDS
jgi:hypothetical protein